MLARSGETGIPVRRVEINVTDLLSSVRDRFDPQHTTVAVSDPDGVTLVGDPERLEQALGNLVDNALRYGGTKVTMRATAQRAKRRAARRGRRAGFPTRLRRPGVRALHPREPRTHRARRGTRPLDRPRNRPGSRRRRTRGEPPGRRSRRLDRHPRSVIAGSPFASSVLATSRYPTPRTVSMFRCSNGRSTLSRR